ncbi:DUF1127 domain-containing protein [Thalassobaculum litoreum]|uniref:YjiS-like domain-containing protein n=1 Tax=Thalassobaculum litoreum DSM 18839 TaxID=1123362 RepID=A0A8G2EYB7_9PROT|nr:DUF1127 domain-containing protein [Thalassobaculum litoreum]SDF56279.1 protein of unknown function [Thalassobaculum litoreum DSM 18839]
MSTQNDILRVPSALPENPSALVARARAMQSAYIRDLIGRAFRSLSARLAHRRTMAAVEDLSPRMLADIGLDLSALRAGVVRRVDVEVVGTPSETYASATAPKTANPVEPHLRAAAFGTAANTDVRHAA